MLVHTVLFWLRKDITESDRQCFFKEVDELREISCIRDFHMGIPAKTPPRPVVDDSYDCAITVTLDSLDAHDEYQLDPLHKSFVDQCSSLWERVVIYDFE